MRLSVHYLWVTALTSQITLPVEAVCKLYEDIYKDGTDLCTNLFDTAFTVVDDSAPGYNMWFFDTDNNPNDLVSAELGLDGTPEVCDAQWDHKDTPSPESDEMRECHPWKQNSCCHSDTVASVETIREYYGPGWDRCGIMSQACERFFVQEACFYECDPHVGYYRKWDDVNSTHEDFNTWQIEGMPIKQSYCDAWYDACKKDYDCGSDESAGCDGLNSEASSNKGLKIGLGVIGGLASIVLLAMIILIHKEKKGEPVFAEAKLQEDNQIS